MATEAKLLDVIDKVYAAALDETAWSDALVGVADLFDATCANLEIIDKATSTPMFFKLGRTPESCIRGYLDYYATVCPRVPAGNDWPTGHVGFDHQFISDTEIDRDEFHADFLLPHGLRYMISGTLLNSDRYCSVIAAQRSPQQGHVGVEEARAMRALIPHLIRALDLQMRLGSPTQQEHRLGGALDQLDAGVIVVDAAGRPTFVNRTAEAILALDDGLSLAGDGLHAVLPATTALLKGLVGRALKAAAENDAMVGDPIAVPRPSLKRPFEVLAAALPPRFSASGIEPGGALILLSDPERRPAPPAAWLARLHGLTPAEARVAVALATGKSPRRIAEETETSIHAVRWHLKQIFQKTGTRRQAELVALLGRGLAVLARSHEDIR